MESFIDTAAYSIDSSCSQSDCSRSDSPLFVSDAARLSETFGRREFRRRCLRRFFAELRDRRSGVFNSTCRACAKRDCQPATCNALSIRAHILPFGAGSRDDYHRQTAINRSTTGFKRTGHLEPPLDFVDAHSSSVRCARALYLDEFETQYSAWAGKAEIHFYVRLPSQEILAVTCQHATRIGTKAGMALVASSLPPCWVPHVRAEMEVMETEKGIVADESTRNENTIITRDAQLSEAHEAVAIDTHISTTEKIHTMNDLVGRWVPLPSFDWNLSDVAGSCVQTMYLPEYLYKNIGKSVNMLPFRSFVYSNYDIEIRFKVNANKFQCGKLLAVVKHDSYQADGIASMMEASFLRTHVEIDVPACNEGQLDIPFVFHRPFIRNIVTNLTDGFHSVRCGKSCTVNVYVLSQLSTGPNGLGTAVIRPFIRFSRAEFAGMSFQQELRAEMEAIAVDLLGHALEKQLNFRGGSNHDKPTDPRLVRIMPSAAGLLTHTIGPAILTPLRGDPTLTTPQTAPRSSRDPTSVYDIARQYGLWARVTWSSANSPGTLLFSAEIDPNRRSFRAGDNDVITPRSYVPTPLEYVSSIYTLWSGTLKIRLDFVSTMFHSGTIMLAAEFNRLGPRALESAPPANSGYTKTFELGDQRSVEFTIPYIYDTVARRTTGTVWTPLNPDVASIIRNTGDWLDSSTVSPVITSYFNVYVINQLRPIPDAPQQIEVLVYIAAGDDFRLSGLKQSHLYTSPRMALDDFPREYKVKGKAKARAKRSAGPEIVHPCRYLPLKLRNAWNEYTESSLPSPNVGLEMDHTIDFQPGAPMMHLQGEDRETSIKDILRRPTVLLDNYELKPWRQELYNLFIPLTPPTNYFNIEEWMYTTHPSRHILSLFRFWRGSMRYTVFVERIDVPAGEYARVHVTTLPHSGTRIVGTQGMYANADAKFKPSLSLRPIWASGCATDVIIPTINPMGQFEAPYVSENSWSLMMEESPNRSYSWRDKGDTNCGHFVLSSNHPCRVTVWWAAGDDFEVSNMYGCPEVSTVQDETCISERYTELVGADDAAQPVNKSTRIDTNEIGTQKFRRQVGETVEEFIPTPSIRAEFTGTLPQLQARLKALSGTERIGHVWASALYIAEAAVLATLPPPFSLLVSVPIISAGSELWVALSGEDLPKVLIRIRGLLNTAAAAASIGVFVWNARTYAVMLPEVASSVYQSTTVSIAGYSSLEQFTCLLYQRPEVIYAGIVGGFLYLTPDLMATAIRYNAQKRETDPTFGMLPYELSEDDKRTLMETRRAYMSATVHAEMGLTIKHRLEGEASTSVVTAADQVSATVDSMATEFQATNVQARATLNNVDSAVNEIKERTGYCSEQIRSVLTVVTSKMEGFFDGASNLMQVAQDLVVDLTIAMLTHQYAILAATLVRTILRILKISISDVWDYITTMTNTIKQWFKPEVRAESDSVLYGILAAMVSLAFKVNISRKKCGGTRKAIMNTVGDGRVFSTMNSALTFVERTFDHLSALVTKALGMQSSAPTILKLMCENESYIGGFVSNAQRIMSEYNADKLGDIDVRNHVLGVHITALHIQKALLQSNVPGMGPLLSFTREFLEWCREHSMDMSCSPIRGVPYCIQIDGPSGIGKSRTAPALSDALLKAANIQTLSSETIYTRSPGAKFWDGYRRQPVIQYDDAFNLRDSEHVSNTVNELYELMTNAPFRPNKADLSEKKLYGNPALVLLLTNEPFPAGVHNASICPEAVLRRRNIMITACWNAGWDRERLQKTAPVNYEHMHFKIWKDPTNKDKGHHAKKYSWDELLVLLADKFKLHWEKERKYIAEEFQRLQARLQNKPVDEVNLLDPYAMFYSTMYTDMTDYHPSDVVLPLDHLQKLVTQAMPQIMESLKDCEIKAEASGLEDGIFLSDGNGECAKCQNHLPQVYRCLAQHKICSTCASQSSGSRCPMCTSIGSKLLPIALTPVVIPVLQYMTQMASNVKEIERHLVAKYHMSNYGARRCITDVLQWVQGNSPWACRSISSTTNIMRLQSHKAFMKRTTDKAFANCPLHDVEDAGRASFYSHDRWMLVKDDETIEHPDASCGSTCAFNSAEYCRAFHTSFWERNKAELELYYAVGDTSRIPYMLRPNIIKLGFFKRWYHYLCSFWDRHKATLIMIGGIASIFLLMNGLIALTSPKELKAENSPYPDNLPVLKTSSKFIRKAPKWDFRAEMEAITDPAIVNRVMTNWVIVRVYKDNSVIAHCVIQGVVGHYAIMPGHFYRRFAAVMKVDGTKMTIQPARYSTTGQRHMEVNYAFDPIDFTVVADSDLAVMRLPANFPLFSDIRKYFATHEDMVSGIPSEGQVNCVPTSSDMLPMVQKVRISGYSEQQAFPSDDGKVLARDVLTYNFAGVGRCGSILSFSRAARPLYGMHIAGNGINYGYSMIITQELLDDVLPPIMLKGSEEVDHQEIPESVQLFAEGAHVEYHGVVAPKMEVHIPRKTKMEPSLIYHVGGLHSHHQPAILHKSDPRYKHGRDPLWFGCMKHGIQSLNFPRSSINMATTAIWDKFFGNMRPVYLDPRRDNYVDACRPKDHPFYDGIKLNSSAGYPWTKYNQSDTTKAQWVRVDEDNHVTSLHPQLLDELIRKEKLRKSGIVPYTLFVDTLKDERLPARKIERAGGTRVFCASPIDQTIAMRQNFNHFCAAMMKARLDVGAAVGINPHSREWGGLARRLLAVGRNIFTIDYSNFGPSFNACVAEAFAKIMVRWSEQNVIGFDPIEGWALLYELIHSKHIMKNLVYSQYSGSPSGAAITTIINSGVNELYVMVAWIHLLGPEFKTEGGLLEAFFENVFIAVYGDDLIASVSDKYRQKFNACTITKFFAEYGIAATDASKGAEVKAWTTLQDATFLKRGFVLHPTRTGEYLAPLKWESVEDCCQWIWRCDNEDEATRVNAKMALMECHGHYKKFSEFKEKINKALATMGIDTITEDWNYLDQMWYTDGLPVYK